MPACFGGRVSLAIWMWAVPCCLPSENWLWPILFPSRDVGRVSQRRWICALHCQTVQAKLPFARCLEVLVTVNEKTKPHWLPPLHGKPRMHSNIQCFLWIHSSRNSPRSREFAVKTQEKLRYRIPLTYWNTTGSTYSGNQHQGDAVWMWVTDLCWANQGKANVRNWFLHKYVSGLWRVYPIQLLSCRNSWGPSRWMEICLPVLDLPDATHPASGSWSTVLIRLCFSSDTCLQHRAVHHIVLTWHEVKLWNSSLKRAVDARGLHCLKSH